MIDLTIVLAALASKRPIFYSEADFQHALAWEIHQQWQESEMRLEVRPHDSDGVIHFDIWATREDSNLVVELKYKTRSLDYTFKNAGGKKESFRLLDQSGPDVARYDFLKDVQRLGGIVDHRNGIQGAAIFLTNDSAYWKPPRDNQTVDADFRIHQDRVLEGELHWGSNASKGTTRTREEPILITRKYRLKWRDYSKPTEKTHGEFRYLLVKI